MQITEAYGLAEWIEEEIVQEEIVQKFQALYAVLNHNATRPQNQPTKIFEQERIELVEGLEAVDLEALSLAQLDALDTLEIKNNVGKFGVDRLTEILSNNLDIALVAQYINEMKNEISGGITKAKAIQEAVEPLIGEDEELASDQVLTRVIFEHDASIRDVQELKRWSTRLYDIGRGFAIAQGLTPQDIRVVGAGKGSLIVELAILATAVIPIATAAGLILTAMVKYREYQIKTIEARQMKEEYPDIADELEEDAVRWEKRAERLRDSIVDNVTEEVRNSIADFRKENNAEFETAVRRLVDLHAKGGTVDCVIPDSEIDNEEDVENAEFEEARAFLRETFAQIRELKETPRLEHFAIELNDNEEDEG